jgi:hypothetical protein
LAHGWVGDGLELGVVWGRFFGHFGKCLNTLGFCIQMLESMRVRCGCLAYNLDLFRFFRTLSCSSSLTETSYYQTIDVYLFYCFNWLSQTTPGTTVHLKDSPPHRVVPLRTHRPNSFLFCIPPAYSQGMSDVTMRSYSTA